MSVAETGIVANGNETTKASVFNILLYMYIPLTPFPLISIGHRLK
jgi:hypothetical protein